VTDLSVGTIPTAGVPAPATATLRARLVLPVLVYCGMCTAVISSLGVLLIPTIAAAQDVSLASAQWILTASLLVGAVATPVLGRCSDGPRRRLVLVAALAVVLAGSVLAATATTFPQLLAGRALQGVTYGIIPVTMSLAREYLPADRVRAGVAALSVTAATGIGLGYPVTGLIAEHLDFRVAFWAAVAFVLPGLLGALVVLPADPPASARLRPTQRFDAAGALLLAAALSAGLLGLSQSARWGWGSTRILALLVGSAVLFAVWACWELRVPAPLIRLDLLRHGDVLLANVTALGLGIAMFVGFSAISRLAQTPESTGYGLGLSVFVAGCVILPLSIGSQVASRFARVVSARIGDTAMLPMGAVFVTVANAGLIARHERLWELLAAMALFGLGIGTAWASMPALIVAAVPGSEVGSATAFNTVLRTIGGSIGSAVTGAVLALHTGANGLPTDSGYRATFALSAAACGVVLVGLTAHAVGSWRRG
jgi:MFS family permease